LYGTAINIFQLSVLVLAFVMIVVTCTSVHW